MDYDQKLDKFYKDQKKKPGHVVINIPDLVANFSQYHYNKLLNILTESFGEGSKILPGKSPRISERTNPYRIGSQTDVQINKITIRISQADYFSNPSEHYAFEDEFAKKMLGELIISKIHIRVVGHLTGCGYTKIWIDDIQLWDRWLDSAIKINPPLNNIKHYRAAEKEKKDAYDEEEYEEDDLILFN